MSPSREVVITGVGVVSPIGIGKDAYWQALVRGQSGVRHVDWMAEASLPVTIGAPVADFEPKQYVKPRKSLKVMCREIQTGFAAAQMAVDDAGLAEDSVAADRYGVLYGSEMFYCDIQDVEDIYRECTKTGEFNYDTWGEAAMSKLYPLWMLMYLPNMVACHIGIAQDARGPNNTITVGEASSLLAVIEAAHIIGRGSADVMIVGGTGTRLNVTPQMYRGDANLSHRNDDPDGASRPFDADRDGMVNGEGAGALILESREFAEARGANILATLAGSGSAYSPRWNKKPLPLDGIQVSIRRALQEAEVPVDELSHVNAHGVGTREDDRREATALQAVVGDTPVTALKSLFGNLGAGGGAVELVASVLSLQHGLVPPTRNYETPDPECPIRIVSDEPLGSTRPAALVLNQSGTGQDAALVLRRS